MLIKLLKSKIHLATITDKNLLYEGSLTLDKELIKKANLRPFEAVWIYNINNGIRFETYLIEGEKGEVVLNGAAARLGEVGDRIIIASYAWVPENELESFYTILVYLDEKNQVLNLKKVSSC
ncbi:aspartate 1-decarboxylase [Thermodesulfobacterium thermophilum]|uniref:aspartate 1-decarboxylase n=1 Tax=Thermodesulfobacterium thermophilum TaxID=886 RepID=UPI0003B393EF|nr:aspartate 1-decarboxylase [Thermodesulfobacterium thermophilum]